MLAVLMLAVGLNAAAPGALDRAVDLNLGVPDLASPAVLDSLLAAERDLPTAARAGRWARRYLIWGEATYTFGLADSGYAARGLLVPGSRHDCISLLYRTTELARAADARHAVELALSLRFAGADPDSVVAPDGRVDYDRPEHLDFSVDMIRSGRWGRDVTADLTGAVPDREGSDRYAPGTVTYVPTSALAADQLREGDLVWLVLDPANDRARELRERYGLIVGHVGMVIVEDGAPWLVHAASKTLPGWYDQPGVVKVPLCEYLARVERYRGVIVTRFPTD